jgi:transposase
MDRIGICSKGGERWHREVVALINLYLKALEALYKGYAQKGFGVSSDGAQCRWARQPPVSP